METYMLNGSTRPNTRSWIQMILKNVKKKSTIINYPSFVFDTLIQFGK